MSSAFFFNSLTLQFFLQKAGTPRANQKNRDLTPQSTSILDGFQFWQYYRSISMLVMEKHTVIYRKIGYTFLPENLPFIRKDDCMIDSVIWRFQEIGKRTMISIVLS